MTFRLCFFFQSHVTHLDLHSFPTRRSSDLSRRAARSRRIRPMSWSIAYTGRRLDHRPSAWRVRSEEHTSELQSPDHLVCRLLLEKKKHRKRVLLTKFTYSHDRTIPTVAHVQ